MPNCCTSEERKQNTTIDNFLLVQGFLYLIFFPCPVLFQTLRFPFFFCSAHPLRLCNHQHESLQSQHISIEHTCSVFRFYCNYYFACCWCHVFLVEYFSHVLICCHVMDKPHHQLCSHPTHPSTMDHPRTPLSTLVVIIILYTSINDAMHIHHSFGCCFQHPHLSHHPSWIFFGPGLWSCVLSCRVRVVTCRPPDPVCVVRSQTGAARAKCRAPSCCLHLPQWPAQCPSPCPTLNPAARLPTAD